MRGGGGDSWSQKIENVSWEVQVEVREGREEAGRQKEQQRFAERPQPLRGRGGLAFPLSCSATSHSL